MLTPNFSLTQDVTHLYIKVDTPYVKFKEVDILVDETEFRLYVQPYFLRLHLPHPVVEDETSVAKYDIEKGQFDIKVTKEVVGQHFEGLDLLTKLLVDTSKDKGKEEKRKNLIEVMDTESLIEQVENMTLEEKEFDWTLPQKIPEPKILGDFGYGFNSGYKGQLSLSQHSTNEVLLFHNPESVSFERRKELRIEDENNNFDPEAYMVDYRDSKQENFQQVLDFEFLINESDLFTNAFNSIEQNQMLNLPKKEFLISRDEARYIYLTLIDIMLATCYDLRVNLGDSNVESSWTIGKLTSAMSCLDRFDTIAEVVNTFVRRAVTFPLYRNSQLIKLVVEDCICILESGLRSTIKLLLYATRLFRNHSHHYVYADILLDDYCVWLQSSAKEEILDALYHQLQTTSIPFNNLGFEWDLTKLEKLVDEPPQELLDLDINSDNESTSEDTCEEDESSDYRQSDSESDGNNDSDQEEFIMEVAS